MSVLREWDSFYVIVGSAAGALIGLQFVVMTLIADRPMPGVSEAGRAFATPTVVHFSASLLVGALVRVPWPGSAFLLGAVGVTGVSGLIYLSVVVLRMLHQHFYRPDMEDLTFHVFLPLASYGLLVLSSLFGVRHFDLALFGIGGATLLLLFIGIHNAWDAVAYHVYVQRTKQTGTS